MEVEESYEEEIERLNWKDFEVQWFIAIWEEMEEEFAKSSNKQGKFLENFFEQNVKP